MNRPLDTKTATLTSSQESLHGHLSPPLCRLRHVVSINIRGSVALWGQMSCRAPHIDVLKWKHFPRYWPFVRGIHCSSVNSPHKGQWRRALMFSLICAWTNAWIYIRYAGDLRRHRAHYDVTLVSCGNISGFFVWKYGQMAHKCIIMPREIFPGTHNYYPITQIYIMSQWCSKFRYDALICSFICLLSAFPNTSNIDIFK